MYLIVEHLKGIQKNLFFIKQHIKNWLNWIPLLPVYLSTHRRWQNGVSRSSEDIVHLRWKQNRLCRKVPPYSSPVLCVPLK